MTRVLLVGCGAAKTPTAQPVRSLYTGALTRAAIAHAEASGCPWYVVSAAHGLLSPDAVIEPYQIRVSDLDRARRRWWGNDIVLRVLALHPGAVLEIHAGADYEQPITAGAFRRALVERPLDRLQIGERLHWYSQRRLHRIPDRP